MRHLLPAANCGKGKDGLTAKSNSVYQHHIIRSRNLSTGRPSGRFFCCGFDALRGRKFPYGNFQTSVFCKGKTQIVGKTDPVAVHTQPGFWHIQSKKSAAFVLSCASSHRSHTGPEAFAPVPYRFRSCKRILSVMDDYPV